MLTPATVFLISTLAVDLSCFCGASSPQQPQNIHEECASTYVLTDKFYKLIYVVLRV